MRSPQPVPASLAACVGQLREIVMPLWRAAEASPHYALHTRLVRENAELYDRHLRKLLSLVSEATQLLVQCGVDSAMAHLATRLVAACYLAADAGDSTVDSIDGNLTMLLRSLRT